MNKGAGERLLLHLAPGCGPVYLTPHVITRVMIIALERMISGWKKYPPFLGGLKTSLLLEECVRALAEAAFSIYSASTKKSPLCSVSLPFSHSV